MCSLTSAFSLPLKAKNPPLLRQFHWYLCREKRWLLFESKFFVTFALSFHLPVLSPRAETLGEKYILDRTGCPTAEGMVTVGTVFLGLQPLFPSIDLRTRIVCGQLLVLSSGHNPTHFSTAVYSNQLFIPRSFKQDLRPSHRGSWVPNPQ